MLELASPSLDTFPLEGLTRIGGGGGGGGGGG